MEITKSDALWRLLLGSPFAFTPNANTFVFVTQVEHGCSKSICTKNLSLLVMYRGHKRDSTLHFD